jgi:hypothetical protein
LKPVLVNKEREPSPTSAAAAAAARLNVNAPMFKPVGIPIDITYIETNMHFIGSWVVSLGRRSDAATQNQDVSRYGKPLFSPDATSELIKSV